MARRRGDRLPRRRDPRRVLQLRRRRRLRAARHRPHPAGRLRCKRSRPTWSRSQPCDAAAIGGCRSYGVILLTDGAESCNGDPVAAAVAPARSRRRDLRDRLLRAGRPSRRSSTRSPTAGGTGHAQRLPRRRRERAGQRPGDHRRRLDRLRVVQRPGRRLRRPDRRGLPGAGQRLRRRRLGRLPAAPGTLVCNGAGDGVACLITDPGDPPDTEVCNGDDDDCDGRIDEGLNCQTPCTPTGVRSATGSTTTATAPSTKTTRPPAPPAATDVGRVRAGLCASASPASSCAWA